MDNRCHHYLAPDVRRVAEVQFDGAEDIAFVEVPLAGIPALIRSGKITHSLTITAFHYLGLFQEAKRLTQRTQNEAKAQKEDSTDERDLVFPADKNLTQRARSEAKAPIGIKGLQSDQKQKRKYQTDIPENEIAKQIVDAAYHLQSRLGPGLLESAYEAALVHELQSRGLDVKQQVILPMLYDGLQIDAAFRIDLLVDDKVIVELKSVEMIIPVYQKQLLAYLKLSDKRLGLLLNFGAKTIKEGIKRVANGLPG
jgi:GxxExxY protein